MSYNETLGSLIYPGTQSGFNSLFPMVEQVEQLCQWNQRQRHRVLWRLDAGFGSDACINWNLAREYQLVVKGHNNLRAKKVVQAQPQGSWKKVGRERWVSVVSKGVRYARRTQTLAVKWRVPKGKEKCALVIHTLLDQEPSEVIHCYDARGAMEAEIKEDKVGLQLVKRRKHRWHAQAAWVILTDMAHNLLTWTHPWMFDGSSFETFGDLRLVQDVLSIPGYVEFGGAKGDKLLKVALQESHPYASEVARCLNSLFKNLQ